MLHTLLHGHMLPEAGLRDAGRGRLDRLSREMDRLLEAAAPMLGNIGNIGAVSGLGHDRPATLGPRPAGAPAINAWRDGSSLFIEAEIPGFRLEDLEVDAAAGALTIRGRRAEARPEGASAIRVERTATSFERSIALPVDVDADRAEASLRNGVLRVTLPIAETARPKRIAIRTDGADRTPTIEPSTHASADRPVDAAGAHSGPRSGAIEG